MSEKNGPPPLWWSPTGGLIRGYGNAGYDDAVPLGVIEDPKHRGPSYWRGFADGRMAERAGVPDPTEENP